MSEWPLTIELTPNGKTLVILYPSPIQEELFAGSLDLFGEPEIVCPGEVDPGNILVLFPHQDMPDGLKELAEHMSTANLLSYLGYEPEGGFSI